MSNARPSADVAPRKIAEIPRKMNAKSGKRVTPKDPPQANDVYVNYSEIPLKLAPQSDYLFLVVAEGKAAEIDLYVDGKIAASTKPGPYPFVACRLLTPAQQNTGNPEKPRGGCAFDAQQRIDGMALNTRASPSDTVAAGCNSCTPSGTASNASHSNPKYRR